jgi:aerobic-type carbon monoxide dehydrogenase small subunit (CoxS/CutS family)
MPTVTELHINGAKRSLAADADRTLLSVLRDDLGLTGAKYGCGEGRCGCCTVLVDGKAVRSCNTRVGAVAGKKLRTIEGLADGDKLHPVQEAFVECGAMQCGYCTPGMIMAAVELLTIKPAPSREEIVNGMNGSVCRCGTYQRIVTAIDKAAKSMNGGAR